MHISNTLKKILREIGDEVALDLLTSTRTEKGDYLGTRSGWFTYLPAGKEVVKPYASRNRVRTTPAKAARRFCMQEHTDKAYEEFHNAFEGRAFSIQNLGIVKGDDIHKAYSEWYDRRRQSSHGQSCMTGAAAYRFELYTRFPEKVRLLVLWDTFKGQKVVVGRALMWATTEGIYIDRIYGSDIAKKFIREYCERKGWLMYNSNGGGGYMSTADYTTKQMFVDLQGDRPRNPPYLDTFRWDGDYYKSMRLRGTGRCPIKR